MNGYFEFIESDNKPECMNIEIKKLEPKDNLIAQFKDFKLPSDDIENIQDLQMLDVNKTSNENLDKEDLFKIPTFKSNSLLNDSHFNFMDAKYFENGNELFGGRNSQIVELFEEKYSEEPKFDKTVHFEPLKNVQGFQSDFKPLFLDKNKPFVHPSQHEHDCIQDRSIKEKHEKSDLTRWGRDEDVLAFKALKEL